MAANSGDRSTRVALGVLDVVRDHDGVDVSGLEQATADGERVLTDVFSGVTVEYDQPDRRRPASSGPCTST